MDEQFTCQQETRIFGFRHLAKAFGDKRLDEISTEDVQRLKAALVERAPKTVNNVLTVLRVGSGFGPQARITQPKTATC